MTLLSTRPSATVKRVKDAVSPGLASTRSIPPPPVATHSRPRPSSRMAVTLSLLMEEGLEGSGAIADRLPAPGVQGVEPARARPHPERSPPVRLDGGHVAVVQEAAEHAAVGGELL
jgi:hypothetical protein